MGSHRAILARMSAVGGRKSTETGHERRSRLLSRLEAERTDKRRRLEYIFQRKLELERERSRLEKEEEDLGIELEQMDSQIDALEDEVVAGKVLIPNSSICGLSAQASVKAENAVADQIHLPLQPSSPATDFLTDPNTQVTQHEYFLEEENKQPTNELELMHRPLSRKSSVVGPLQLVHSTKKKKPTPTNNENDENKYTNIAVQPSNPHTMASTSNQSDAAVTPWTQQIHQTLRNTFRINHFRENQENIINATLDGRDVFVIMKTGGGKSLCYQLPAVIEGRGPQRKITLVVSPLLSLIQDQENQMNQFIRNSALSFVSGMGSAQHTEGWNRVRDPSQGVCLIFVTPEKVSKSGKLKAELQKLYEQGRLGRFVIDECHCACQWGHDFRPDYTQLGQLKSHFPSIPIIAVTATASDQVREDVCRILRLGTNYKFFRSTANRPNLTYSVRVKPDNKEAVIEDMVDFIKTKHPRDAGIIYTFTKKDAENVAASVNSQGISAACYHADVSKSRKEKVHNDWMIGKLQVVVATIAFGLGINKPDVRFVLHHSISKTLEAYYQESGRAGRDGNPADCLLYYAPKDVPRLMKMVHGTSSEPIMWPMIRYGQASGNDEVCKAIMMSALGEPNCQDPKAAQEACEITEKREVGTHARTVAQLLCNRYDNNEQLTMPMLVKEWRKKPATADDCVQANPPLGLSSNDCERIVVALLMEGVLDPDIVWTSYDSIVYLKPGRTARQLAASGHPSFVMRFPKAILKAQPTTKRTKTPQEGSLIAKKKDPKKRKIVTKKTVTKKGTKAKTKKSVKKTTEKKQATSRRDIRSAFAVKKPEAEIIDLLSEGESSFGHDADDIEEVDDEFWGLKGVAKCDNRSKDSDSEIEFEG